MKTCCTIIGSVLNTQRMSYKKAPSIKHQQRMAAEKKRLDTSMVDWAYMNSPELREVLHKIVKENCVIKGEEG